MSGSFTCEDCGATVFPVAGSWADRERTRCFLCDWVRAEEPDDEEARDELRRLVNRE